MSTSTIASRGQHLAKLLHDTANQISDSDQAGRYVDIPASKTVNRDGTDYVLSVGRCLIVLQGDIDLPPSLIDQIKEHLKK